MHRRSALKQMASALGGIVTIPAWAYGWSSQQLETQPTSLFTPEMETLVSEVVETLIPATDTPGAKELGVDKFIHVMLRDCYPASAQEAFTQELHRIEEKAKQQFGRSFTASTSRQRTQLLQAMDQESTPGSQSAFTMIKNLTIQGYLNSEYVLKNLLKYELIPARFDGCAPVPN